MFAQRHHEWKHCHFPLFRRPCLRRRSYSTGKCVTRGPVQCCRVVTISNELLARRGRHPRHKQTASNGRGTLPRARPHRRETSDATIRPRPGPKPKHVRPARIWCRLLPTGQRDELATSVRSSSSCKGAQRRFNGRPPHDSDPPAAAAAAAAPDSSHMIDTAPKVLLTSGRERPCS